jgi:hypothetical protein
MPVRAPGETEADEDQDEPMEETTPDAGSWVANLCTKRETVWMMAISDCGPGERSDGG